ncbi:MAG: hypothetical protein AAFX03_01705 [Pseudomonadota bacterium]
MAQSIKISDQDMEIVRREAELSSRSIAGQVAHWMRIGRSIERAPEFTYAHVREVLEGRRGPDALTGEEQAVYVDALVEAVSKPTAEQEAFFAKRKKAGLGVGADKSGAIVKQTRKIKGG